MQTLTDNALMLQVKAGDTNKLGLLYERYKKPLFGFFYNRNSNADLSEDLVQNVFIRILKYKHTFTGEGSFAAWMFKMARNVGYDDFKKNEKKYREKPLSNMEYRLQDADDINTKHDKQNTMAQLSKALQQISPEKREIILLGKYRDLKFKEIGEILNCSEGNAKVKMHRALKDLRNCFLKLEEN